MRTSELRSGLRAAAGRQALPWLAIPLMLALSFALRATDVSRTTGAPNLEASYHVLLTVTALAESPVARHWFLPTVSLGQENDKHIPWGGTVPTRHGDYIYTSFAPPGFVLPYAYFHTFGMTPDLRALAVFNFTLQAVATLLLYQLVRRVLRLHGVPGSTATLASLAAASIGVFSREALFSFGVVYWSQSLYQVILLASLLLFVLILEKQRASRPLAVALAFTCFLGAWTEWSGFIFNSLFAVLLWRERKNVPGLQSAALLVVLATVLAGLVILLHYSAVVGPQPFLMALARRFVARGAARGGVYELLQAYVLSYGLLIPLLLALAVYAVFATAGPERLRNGSAVNLMVIAACLPLVENVVMLQHAIEFSFDRLKWVIPAALLTGLLLAYVGQNARLVFLGLLCVALYGNYRTYRNDLDQYAAWPAVDARNQRLKAAVAELVDLRCAIIASDIKVRGYTSLLFHRGVHERLRKRDVGELMKQGRYCAGVFLEGEKAFTDLPAFSRATVYYSRPTAKPTAK